MLEFNCYVAIHSIKINSKNIFNHTFLSVAFVSAWYLQVDRQVVFLQEVFVDLNHPAFVQTHVHQYSRMFLIAQIILHFHHL